MNHDNALKEAADNLRALSEAATPGPWKATEPVDWDYDDTDRPQAGVDAYAKPLTWDDHGGQVFEPADADLIATMRNVIDLLADWLEMEHFIGHMASTEALDLRLPEAVRLAEGINGASSND